MPDDASSRGHGEPGHHDPTPGCPLCWCAECSLSKEAHEGGDHRYKRRPGGAPRSVIDSWVEGPS